MNRINICGLWNHVANHYLFAKVGRRFLGESLNPTISSISHKIFKNNDSVNLYFTKQQELLMLHMWQNHRERKVFLREELKEVLQSGGHTVTFNKLEKILFYLRSQEIFHVIKGSKNRVYVNLTEYGKDEAKLLQSRLNGVKEEPIPIACSKLSSEKRRSDDAYRNSIYRSFSPDTGQVQYVGRTNNINRRRIEHLRQKNRTIFKVPELTNLSLREAKAVEQALIDLYGTEQKGGVLQNTINSIGKPRI